MSSFLAEYDVVIVGSGAGGGTVAQALAPLCADGARIAILDWGGRFTAADNTRREIAMAEKYYFESGGFQTASQDMTLAFARAVGGSTTVYTGTSLQAPSHVLDRWGVTGINAADLAPRYRRYIQENNVHLNDWDELNDNNRLFSRACQALGWKSAQFPVNTKGCEGLGTCNLGCAKLAKQGTAVVQIPKAEGMGVEVVPFCRVDRIEKNALKVTVVPPEHGLARSPWPAGEHRIGAKRIVVCAGAVNSPALLLRSFGEALSPALGRYFTCHPALILAAEHPAPISNVIGHPKSFYCDEFAETGRFILETCMYFPFTLSKSLSGLGKEVDELLGAYEKLQMILVLAIDDALESNRVVIDRAGNPKVHYKLTQNTRRALVDAVRASAEIFFEAGAVRMHSPCSSDFFLHARDRRELGQLIDERLFLPGRVSLSAAHLMGGCRMGDDSGGSVTDSWGKVHGLDGVYVADASLFPAAVEVNPYLTVMALADRVAEGVRRDLR
ncbi:MAG: GMC family oxidoreductase [Bdellovibrionales bacterium]|nr:GMC family oxidoreductase [Bdellovibrionales bacterium]